MIEIEQETHQEARAILINLDTGSLSDWDVEDSLDELERLADTAEAVSVGRLTQKLPHPHPKHYLGTGKIDELQNLVETLKANVLIFDDELSPRQLNTLEDIFKDIRVMDRTSLILDIFSMHASSREGKLQVELATLEYELPRLRGMWTHFEKGKLGGGVGSRFGEGETQLEADRRLARKRIAELKREIKRIESERDTQRARRLSSGVFRMALVGYTNAGKSSLLNALTGAGVLAYDKLFATLDSTTRKYELPSGRLSTITDTVGFINKLPHQLVAAFQSTLIEVKDADLLLHLVDASSVLYEDLIIAVEQVLHDIKAHEIPRLLIFNKIDLLQEDELEVLKSRYPQAIFVSALQNSGFDDLNAALESAVAQSSKLMKLHVPYEFGQVLSRLHDEGVIIDKKYLDESVEIVARVHQHIAAKYEEYEVE